MANAKIHVHVLINFLVVKMQSAESQTIQLPVYVLMAIKGIQKLNVYDMVALWMAIASQIKSAVQTKCVEILAQNHLYVE